MLYLSLLSNEPPGNTWKEGAAQVIVDQLVKAVPGLSVAQQSEWLHAMGIDELVSEGMQYWEANKTSPDVAALKMRSRANEAQALVSEDGLGSFTVLGLVQQG